MAGMPHNLILPFIRCSTELAVHIFSEEASLRSNVWVAYALEQMCYDTRHFSLE